MLIYSIWTGPHMRAAVDQQQPFTSDQQAIIRAEMERLLRAPEFSGSKRCSDFLTYAVEQTLLGGQEAELKERTVAVEVFGRSPDYDSSDDSIVRVTARDLRKRLAQCYVGAAADHPVRIELAAGSYRARFRWPAIETTRSPEARRPWLLTASAAAVAAAFLLGWFLHRPAQALPEVLRAFWSPALESPGGVLLCVGTPTVYDVSDRLRYEYMRTLPEEARMRPFAIPFAPNQSISGADIVPQPGRYAGFGNLHTTADLVALMNRAGKPWQVRTAVDVSFAELRLSPAILIGGESNTWTQPLTAELRFYFTREGATVIRDRQDPSRQWPASGAGNGRMTEDFAIVSRIIDSKTDKFLVFLGGRTQFGTQAAGELVTHSEHLLRALVGAPSDWPRKNMQLVIRSQIHGSTPSTPTVLAAHFF